jgi:hypothetical protein
MKSPALLFMLFVFAAFGCGGHGAGSVVEPSPNPDQNLVATNASATGTDSSIRSTFGLWTISVSSDHQSMEAVPVRDAAMHLNVVGFLEVSPCTNCLKIKNIKVVSPQTIEASLEILHPIQNQLKFTGFDVRGIFITAGDYTFPKNNRIIAVGDDLPRLLNPNGYTSIFNPTEYPSSSSLPPELKYFPGKHSNGTNLTATLNPYLAYRTEQIRCSFSPSSNPSSVYMQLHAPTGAFKFGYAVDASWMKVDGEVKDIKDFPLEANCPEAYQVNVKQWNVLKPEYNSNTLIYVEIYDHQGLQTIKNVHIEAPDIFTGEVTLTNINPPPYDTKAYVFKGNIYNSKLAPAGKYPMLVTVTDTQNDINLGEIKAYQVFMVHVANGWLDTWGGSGNSYNWLTKSTIDKNGNIYVCGVNYGDKDPSPEVLKGEGAYISKFDKKGDLIWTYSWYSYTSNIGMVIQSITADTSGALYLTGQFEALVDFDPGAGKDEHQSPGGHAIFLTKLDTSGYYKWTRTWGGGPNDEYVNPGNCGLDVVSDTSGNIFVVGTFTGLTDFDPGPEVFEIQPVSSFGSFLTKFKSTGDFEWALSWGGGTSGSFESWCDGAYGVQWSAPDNIYVFGHFSTLTDFDPGTGVVERDGNAWDRFLVKFKENEFQWVCTWESYSIARLGRPFVVDKSGDIYLTGTYYYGQDIDPTEGELKLNSEGAYVTKLNASAELQWIKLLSLPYGYSYATCFPLNVITDDSCNVTVAGSYSGTIDFDPSDGVDIHTNTKSGGSQFGGFAGAGFVCQLSREGVFNWADSFGDNQECIDSTCSGLVADSDGNIYASGIFEDGGYQGTDFDPGPLTEYRNNGTDGNQYLMMIPPDGKW